jgi:formamidopyrimidine-DNA glycosylase
VPELPELEALRADLVRRLVPRRVARVELASLSALKTYRPPLEALLGATFSEVERRGKYLCLRAVPEGDGAGNVLWLVVHLARGGWVRWHETAPAGRARPGRGPLALRVALDNGTGFDVTEMGTQKRLALWLVGDLGEVPPLRDLGPEPLAQDLSAEALGDLLEGSTATLKKVLTDQKVLAGIGNAYSDEILHAARLSPFRPAGRLDTEELARLHRAISEVLGEAVGRAAGHPAAELKGEKKEGLRVHGRAGQPCPVCGDTVAQVSFADRSLEYCPTCQTGGKVLADRRLSRLLK